ncbi:hypothetical protein CKAH01_13947 [Colletotrichum kahawae]|uniref:Uncharacterized protein n=1 Tax=Colletotrichum kahawae TaxID=34407 RepID=A0AAE0DAH4_COLKA|nr:hypothetical protein CKAH01_13947 [Colletotrichum kahawae]
MLPSLHRSVDSGVTLLASTTSHRRGTDIFLANPRVDAPLQRVFHGETLTASQNRLSRGTSVKAMREVDTIDISHSPQRAGITAFATNLVASIPLDIGLGPLRRPWVYSPFAMARFTCRVEMALGTVTHPGQQSHGSCEGERELQASTFNTSCDSVGDMLDQILDIPGKIIALPSNYPSDVNSCEAASDTDIDSISIGSGSPYPRPYIRLETSTGDEDSLTIPSLFHQTPIDNELEVSCNHLPAVNECETRVSDIINGIVQEIDALLEIPQLVSFRKRHPDISHLKEDVYADPSEKPEPLCVPKKDEIWSSAKPAPLRVQKDTATDSYSNTTLAMPEALQINKIKRKPVASRASSIPLRSKSVKPVASPRKSNILQPISANGKCRRDLTAISDKENWQCRPTESTELARSQANARWAEWSLEAQDDASLFGDFSLLQSPGKGMASKKDSLFSSPDPVIYIDPEERTTFLDLDKTITGPTTPLPVILEEDEPDEDDSIDFLLDPIQNAPIRPNRNLLLDCSVPLTWGKEAAAATCIQGISPDFNDDRSPFIATAILETPCPRRSVNIDALIHHIAQPLDEPAYDEDGFLIEPTAAELDVGATDLDEQLSRRRQAYPSQILLWPLRQSQQTAESAQNEDEDASSFAVSCNRDEWCNPEDRLPEVYHCGEFLSLRERFAAGSQDAD